MTEIYELTKYQAANLKKSANQPGCTVFAVVGAAPDDTKEQQATLEKELKEMGDLVELGLLKDVSEDFGESIKVSEIANKRSFKVYAITETGLLMFRNDGRRQAN